MAWTTILSTQTDANSPLNQALFDAIRGNLEYLYGAGAQLEFLSGADNNEGGSPGTFEAELDSDIDWRDRFIAVLGVLHFTNSAAESAKYVPGGGDDDHITIDATDADGGQGSLAYSTITGFFFSEAGHADGSGTPRLAVKASILDGSPTVDNVAIYADSSSGALKLTFTTIADTGGSGCDCVSWNLLVIRSEDRGAV